MVRDADDYPPDDSDEPDPVFDKRPYLLHVEGERAIYYWDEVAKIHADRLEADATALGLHVFRRRFAQGADPDEVDAPRRWTGKRVGLDQVFRFIASRPGTKFTEIIERLYAEHPWSDRARRRATAKLRTSLARLKADNRVVKRFDYDGNERWEPVGDDHTLLMPKHGRASPTAHQLDAGVAVLRKLNVYSVDALARDPTLYEDLARHVYLAIVQAGQNSATSPFYPARERRDEPPQEASTP